jgi:hypothetical protein
MYTKRDGCHRFWWFADLLLMSRRMFALATLIALIHQVSGTPYVTGGDSPAGTDCSGLASWVSNTATGRPVYGDRFNTGNEEAALLARGFQYGSAPGALVIGWNGRHTAVTLPDGTPVASGEGGGVRSRWGRRLSGAVHPPHVPSGGPGEHRRRSSSCQRSHSGRRGEPASAASPI